MWQKTQNGHRLQTLRSSLTKGIRKFSQRNSDKNENLILWFSGWKNRKIRFSFWFDFRGKNSVKWSPQIPNPASVSRFFVTWDYGFWLKPGWQKLA
jgi:hypothetical protein